MHSTHSLEHKENLRLPRSSSTQPRVSRLLQRWLNRLKSQVPGVGLDLILTSTSPNDFVRLPVSNVPHKALNKPLTYESLRQKRSRKRRTLRHKTSWKVS